MQIVIQFPISRRAVARSGHESTASSCISATPNATAWPGTQLELWTPNGGTNQQWLVRPTGNGTYTIESRSDGDVLDVCGASTMHGAAIDRWYPNGNNNQPWTLVPVS